MFDEDGMLQYTETQLAELLTFYQTLIRDRLVLLVDQPALRRLFRPGSRLF